VKVLVLNGPNLDLLGEREPEVYGSMTLAELEAFIADKVEVRNRTRTDEGHTPIVLTFFQSNSEGTLIETIHEARHSFDGIVFNPAAYTHYSYALHDAIKAIDTPVVEVHLSDISAREAFRAVSVTAPACIAQIAGKGADGYVEAIDILLADARTPR
jgi:3-dehydroquinate dehydratase type II